MPDKTNIQGANRREYVRVAPDRRAPVRVDINGNDFIEVTNAVDISEGGVRISVKHHFAGCHVDLPASVVIYLPAPVARHFTARGRIRHVLGDSFGVQFIGLNPAHRALLREYVGELTGTASPQTNFFGQVRKLFGMAP